MKDQALQIEQLKARLVKLLRQRFGSSSEKLRGQIDQLQLIIGDLEEEYAETTPPETEPEPEPAIEPQSQTRRRKAKRRPLPENLPRDVVEPHRLCLPEMRRRVAPAGRGRTEILEYVPRAFRVHPACASQNVLPLLREHHPRPGAQLPINRGLAGPGLLANVLVGKFCDHLPLYRQAEIFARKGIDLDRSPLADSVGQSAALLRPLVDAVGLHVMAADRVDADDTTVPVLSPGNGETRTGRLWCYVRDDHPFARKAPKAALYC